MTIQQVHLSRLRWACRRGMLELDLMLLPFFDEVYTTLDAHQQESFARLLDCNDPEIFAWLMGHEQTEDLELDTIIQRIRSHARD